MPINAAGSTTAILIIHEYTVLVWVIFISSITEHICGSRMRSERWTDYGKPKGFKSEHNKRVKIALIDGMQMKKAIT